MWKPNSRPRRLLLRDNGSYKSDIYNGLTTGSNHPSHSSPPQPRSLIKRILDSASSSDSSTSDTLTTTTTTTTSTTTASTNPSLGSTGQAISIAVVVTLFVLFCIGVASYFRWGQRTRFYQKKGQFIRIWNYKLCGKSLSEEEEQGEVHNGFNNNRNNGGGNVIVRATTPSVPVVVTAVTAIATEATTISPTITEDASKRKTMVTLGFFRLSKISRPLFGRAKAATGVITAVRKFKPQPPPPPPPPPALKVARHGTLGSNPTPSRTLYGHSDPAIRAYMDKARRDYAQKVFRDTGKYPVYYSNHSVPTSAPITLTLVQEKATMSPRSSSDSLNSSISLSQYDGGGGGAVDSQRNRSKIKSVWERTSNIFTATRPIEKEPHVSKNHVSRYFRENARSNPFPLYAPTYNSEEGDDDDEDNEVLEAYTRLPAKAQDAGKELGVFLPRPQQQQKQQWLTDIKVQRDTTTVEEAKAKMARIIAQAEEMKVKASAQGGGREGGRGRGGTGAAVPTMPHPVRINYAYNSSNVTTNNKYVTMKSSGRLCAAAAGRKP